MLEKLMSDIDGVFSQTNSVSSDLSTLTIGSYCMAKFSEDEAWYRAQIKSHVPGSGYGVFFIDYGNSETVSESEVANITSDFMKLPPLCFECQLLHAPADSNLDNNTAFQNLIDEAEEITAKIEEFSKNVYVVTLLYDKDSEEVNINNVLFGSSSDAPESVSKDAHFLSPDVPLGLQDGYITVVNSPQDFYIQLSSCEDSLADLSSKLSDVCEAMTDSKTTVQNPCVGLACCAKFSEDNNWYRAEILNLTDTTASVLFVDYGNVDDVPKTSLKILTEEYLQIPPYAIKCKLNGIVPVTEQWSEEAVTTFQDMVLDSPLAITFISKDIPAIVNVAKDDKDAAQYLVDMELANVDTCTETEEAYAEDHLTSPLEEQFSLSNDQSYPNRKLSSSKLLVKISYVDTYNKFYVIPLELSTELDTITKTLELLYQPDADKPPVPIEPEDIKANMPCVAKCGEGTWCRAIITEVDVDNIYVTLVDYGTPELLAIKNLRAINPELVEIPPVAVECSLFGVQAIEGNEKKITAKLDYYFVEETELMMEICESKPYKVKLNCNGDFAEMLIAEGLAKFDSCAKNEQVTDNFISGSSIIVDEEPSKVKHSITTYSVFGLDEILGNVKYAEIENDLIILHVVPVDADLKLEVMQERLQTVYNESENKVIQVKEMDFCVAKYTEDESWYRAKVVACYDGKVKVKFIDYGNCDTVDMENIYELLPEFAEACQFSVKFCLSGFKMFENKSEELQNKLDEYVYNEPLLLKLCKYKHDVPGICTAKVLFGDMDLAELLIDEELLFQQYVLNSELDNSFEATIGQNKGGILYVLPVKLEEERDTFQTELEKYCNMCEMIPSINKWRLYAAKYSEHWFRSTVLSCSSDEADVKFVDFCHEAKVKISDLVSLPAEMSHQPVFLQPCVVKEIKGILDESYEKILDKIPLDTAVFCELLETRSYPHAVKLSFTDPEFSLLTDSADEASNTYCESTEKKDAESAIKSESDNELQPQLNGESSLIYDLNANSEGPKINEELEPSNNKYSDKSDDFGFDDSVINSGNLQPILNYLSMKEVEVSNEETKLEKQITDFAKDDDFVNRDILRNEPHHDNFSENESFSNDTEVNQKIDDENSDEFKLPAEQFESVPKLDEYQGIERKDKIWPSSNTEDSGYTFENSKELIEDNHVVLDDNGIPEYKESTNASREPMQLMNNTINDISNAESISINEVPKYSDCETYVEGSKDNRYLSGSVKVIVSSIAISDDGSIILAVIPMQFQEQLSNFNRDLNLAYSCKDLSSSYNPESKFCAVFTDENEWRRAQVIHEEEKLTVSFIDYGVIDSVDISTAQDLDPKFANIPPFAVWCTLAAISCSPDKSNITKEYLENAVKSKEAVITIIEDNEPYQVSLYVDGLDIVNELLLNDMVASKFGIANIEPGHYSAKMSHLTTELKHLELFVNLIPQWESFESLQSSMQNAYTVKNEKIQVRKLQAYAVWHDSKWSRCTILSCDDEIILNLIDSGEKISYSSTLCPLLPEHCLHPPYAVPCEIPSSIHTDHKEAADMLNDIFGSEFLVYVERDVHTDSLVSRLEDTTIINRLKNMQETLSYPDLEESTSEGDFDQSEPAQETRNVSHSDTSEQDFDQSERTEETINVSHSVRSERDFGQSEPAEETINVSHSDASERDFDQSEPARETVNVSHSDTSERDFDQSEPAEETVNVSHSDTSEQDFDQSEPARETINVSYSDSNLKSDEMQEQEDECLQNEAETVIEVLGIPQADDITQKEELRSELPHVDFDSFHPEQEENKEVTSNDCLEKDGSEKDDINQCDATETSQAINDSFDFEKKEEKELRVNNTLEDTLKNEIVLENAHVDSELPACNAEQESISKCEQFQESFRKTELLETTQSSSPNKPEKEELIGYLKESFSTQPLQECSESTD
ncbi:Tudor domain-containing protein 1, partial [Stegodyphus mimosarum]